MSKIVVIGVPFNLGSGRDGAQYGPSSIRDLGIVEQLQTQGIDIEDLGDIPVPVADVSNIHKGHQSMKYADVVVNVDTELARRVRNVVDVDVVPIIIGGDHSIALGSISGASTALCGDLGVVWIDAHGDINTDQTSPSGNIHGMPLAAAMGLGSEMLTGILDQEIKVFSENVVLVGTRSLDQGEVDLIDNQDISVIYMKDIKADGIAKSNLLLTEIINDMPVNNIHLSIDIDVLDPKLVPGTGTPAANGMNLNDLYKILDTVFATNKVCSIDIVELNTKLDHEDHRTVKLVGEILKYVVKKLQ